MPASAFGCLRPQPRLCLGDSRPLHASQHLHNIGESVTDVYKAIADPTRRAILDELADKDGQTLFEICKRLITKHDIDSSRQAISQHLDVLEEAGLVSTRRDGRYKFHHVDFAPLRAIVNRWPIPEEEP